MALDKEAAQKILAQIDREELAQLGCELTSIPSPTGKEKAVAEFILAWFATNGLKAVRQDVRADRPKGVGILKGTGTGLSLGFNGQTDTSFTGTDEDLRMVGNIEPAADLKGRIVGNRVQGLGISNMKGGVAAFMIAGKALKKSGIKLRGDVILAAVVGEISRTPIGSSTRWSDGERSSNRNTSTILPLAHCFPRLISARSRAVRPTGRTTSPAFVPSMSTCAYLLTSARSRSSMNWSKPSTNSALITRWTSTNRSSVTREKMSSRWSSRQKKSTSTCSAKRSSRKRRTAPASGPTPTSTTSWGYQPSRSARAAGASAQETKRS